MPRLHRSSLLALVKGPSTTAVDELEAQVSCLPDVWESGEGGGDLENPCTQRGRGIALRFSRAGQR